MADGPRSRPELLLARLARMQMRHPWRFLAAALVSIVVAGLAASRLTLQTNFGELLPQNKRSVVVARYVQKRLPSMATLTIVAHGKDDRALERFVDALVPELKRLGPEWVGAVSAGAAEARTFLHEKRFLYADLALVKQVHDEVHERYDYEVNKKAGFLLDDDDAPPPLTEGTIRARLEKKGAGQAEKQARERFPEYYLDREQHLIAVLVRTPIAGTGQKAPELRRRVDEVVRRVDVSRFDPAATIGYTGNFITSAETYATVKDDLAHVGFWGAVLIFGVVFLFYLRIRTLLAMVLTVGIGAVWTFGLAHLTIGHLNSSTGFLFSIVVGNGINFGIIYMARYLEERRAVDPEEAAVTAHQGTWLSTLTAAGAATAAYGSLVVTDFRGFKHFGVIGGSGMLLCWLATYLFLPPILAVSERVWPIKPASGLWARLGNLYGKPFAFLAERYPLAITAGALALTVVAVLVARPYVADPMEYDMKNIANKPPKQRTDARALGALVDRIVGRQGQDGRAIVTDRLEQVLPLKAELEKRAAAAPRDRKPFEEIVTIHSLLPGDQAAKIGLVERTRQTLLRARAKGFIGDADWAKLAKLIPDKKLAPVGIDDLPQELARPFMERDGTRGRIVYIVPTNGRSVWDGRYLIEFAASFRETRLPDGSVVEGSGDQVIYADMIIAVTEDAPKAIVVSLLATLLIIAVAFRGHRSGFGVILSVAVAFCWLLAVLAVWNSKLGGGGSLAGLRLNFLNFVALPITIGVGADYGVNVMQRYRQAGSGHMRQVIVETGGAVILCSLTTTLGYLALTLSVNKAINSFGVAAAAGEIACVLCGVLVLPAALIALDRRRARQNT